MTLQSLHKNVGYIPASIRKAVQRANHICEWAKTVSCHSDIFIYLGSTLSRVMYIDDEVTAITAKARVAFGRLRENVQERSKA